MLQVGDGGRVADLDGSQNRQSIEGTPSRPSGTSSDDAVMSSSAARSSPPQARRPARSARSRSGAGATVPAHRR
ncbi:hypothetical protein ACFVYA_30150 [Amycolatopsis sp. NPDC058278]|uniref:hypothetical protein n=1 Tax=Amycolatopsis sp. NPDC058278 TaxID=3346417 RepID=UPI0036DD36DB